jgi:transcriptional regulator with XRE-family HTH domain
MTIPQKLAAIQTLSGLSQTELARQLGVSFVAFNRWKKGKAVPRPNAAERIDAFYREYTGLAVIPDNILDSKKRVVLARRRMHSNLLQTIQQQPDILDQFVLTLTYTSDSIEGSTLTEAETAVVLFQDATLPDKTLREQLEAKNHQAALLYLFDFMAMGQSINEMLILRLHAMLMNGIRPRFSRSFATGLRRVGISSKGGSRGRRRCDAVEDVRLRKQHEAVCCGVGRKCVVRKEIHLSPGMHSTPDGRGLV